MNNRGTFVISLDLELNWGVFDVFSLTQYKQHLLGAREVVPILLKRFNQHHIHATWGVVGLLFFPSKEELINGIPDVQPQYNNLSLSSYQHLKHIGENEMDDPYHFGKQLIDQIKRSTNQEIGTHTFSHYYCLADGQNIETFRIDLLKAIQLSEHNGIHLNSIIFPRNQVNEDYLQLCKVNGVGAYRGCEHHWLYQIHSKPDGKVKRAVRLLDSYINISGHHIYGLDELLHSTMLVNVPSSRFFRPYSQGLRLLEPLKLRRIKNGMTKAAKEGKVFHLWWHPHNFGAHIKENISMLDLILEHFNILHDQYGMESLSMEEVSERVRNKVQSESNQVM